MPGVGVVERESGAGEGVWLLDERSPESLNSAWSAMSHRGARMRQGELTLSNLPRHDVRVVMGWWIKWEEVEE